jgi:1-acyl-sn-glycerol-3-phosphate acyltransferase
MINPFVNTTEKKLSRCELIKTIILAPIAVTRLITTFVLMFLMLLTLYISSIGYSSNEENLSKCSKCFFLINQFISNFLNRLKRLCCKKKQNTTIYHEMSKIRRCLLFLVQLEARFIMFVLGYVWIKEIFPNTKKYMMFPSYLERQGAPKICVANHVSFVDTFYFLSRCVPRSVVIQASIAGPFTWAMNAFSPILVPVTQKQRKQLGDPRDQIHRNLETDVLKRPLIIFPEGGTTQSNTLIKFQDGAFLDMQTVQPLALKYTYKNFDPSWTNDVSPIWLMFKMCCQFYNCLTVEYYDPISPILKSSTVDIIIETDDSPQPKEIETDKLLIDNFKKKVYERYASDPFFVQTPYTLSDSRITSKLFKIKKFL